MNGEKLEVWETVFTEDGKRDITRLQKLTLNKRNKTG